VAAGVALCLPALGLGLLFDDLSHREFLIARLRDGQAPGTWWNMFELAGRTDAGETARAIALGAVPWWASPRLVVAFLRPLAVASHALDYSLWPDLPWLMHAHSLAWYALVAGGAALLYRRVQGPSAQAGLAALLYAVDEAHAAGASWIAARNTLMTAAFALGTLLLWTRARTAARRGWPTALAALSLLCAHASSEGAFGAWPYLLAYALVLDGAGRRRATIALWPLAAVSGSWLALAAAGGFRVQASASYVDPRTDPLAFAQAVAERLPLLLHEQFGLPLQLEVALSRTWQHSAAFGAYLLIALATAVAWPLVRQRPAAQFFALGALGSAVLTCTAPIEPRLLFMVGIGAHGLIAETVVACLRGLTGSMPARALRGAVAATLLALHLPLAISYISPTLQVRPTDQREVDAVARGLPRDRQTTALIVLNTHDCAFTVFVAGQARALLPSPPFLYVLGASEDPVKLTRPRHDALVLEPTGGYLREATSQFLRHPKERFAPGQTIAVGDWRIVVERVTRDGRPARVRMEVPKIDDPALGWITWRESSRRFERVALPPVGGALWL